jgi:DNA primase
MEIAELKSRLSILEVAQHLGITTDRHGKALCPFHDDKKPSLQFSKEKNICTCFSGNCSAGTMDIIGLTEKYLKLTTHDAIMKLKEWAGDLPATNGKTEQSESKADYEKLFKLFQSTLKKSSQAQDYIKSRHLSLAGVEAGYNESQWPQMKHCVIFPLKDKNGKTVSLYGRSIRDNPTAKHFYTKNRQGLSPRYPESSTKQIVLTESVIDAATLDQLRSTDKDPLPDHTQVLACYGTNGLTEEHLQALRELKDLQEVVIFFDGDAAGKEGVLRCSQLLRQHLPHVTISNINTPEGEDINSLAQGHSLDVFNHLLQTRQVIATAETIKTNTQGQLDTSNPEYITYRMDELRFTLLGGISLQQTDRLRVTLRMAIGSQDNPLQSFRHSIDLYNDDQTEKYIRKASERLNVSSSQVNRAIASLIHELERYRWHQSKQQEVNKPEKRKLTEERAGKAIAYLKATDLMQRTGDDIGKSGVTGEELNRLLMYIIFTSRLLERPLHVISLGNSGTGKTYLQEKVAELFPKHEKVELTSSTDNAFYYFDKQELVHKIVIVEDMDGVGHILYTLRELQSKKRISRTVPLKDSKGNLKTIRIEVEGPICLAGTTTQERLYEDNADRCILIYLDNSAAQQARIMEYQRKLSAGKVNVQQEEELKEFFRDIQTILKRIKVRNPYAEFLKIPEQVLKPLRTNMHYLGFIEAITLYHQYQRDIKQDQETGEPYIETNLEYIAWANRLLKEALLAKSDELNGACRKFFEQLKAWMKEENKASFYAQEVRSSFRMNPSKLKRYLIELTRYGCMKIAGGNRYNKGHEYELIDPQEYEKLRTNVSNVLDQILAELRSKTTRKK